MIEYFHSDHRQEFGGEGGEVSSKFGFMDIKTLAKGDISRRKHMTLAIVSRT